MRYGMRSVFFREKESPMDHIDLKGMAFFGYHGDEPEETKLGQRFYIDVEMDLDLSRVGETDALEDSVNYVAVYEIVKRGLKEVPINCWKDWQALSILILWKISRR